MTEKGTIKKYLRIKMSTFYYTEAGVNPAESLKSIEELYNTTRVNQEKRLNKISKQLEVLNVTIRKINSSKKQTPTSTVFDKVLSVYITYYAMTEFLEDFCFGGEA